jgi:hypothetical protein
MRTSNLHLAALLLLAAMPSTAPADELTLAIGDSRLSGSLRSINDAGVVELTSELSPEPLMLRNGMLRKVEFSLEQSTADPPEALVVLANGDLLPATIESLNEQVLTVESPLAGRLEIPRQALRSLQLGVRQQAVVFSGPNSIEEWTAGGDLKNWVFERDSLVSRGPSSAAKEFDLPEQFILRFKLRWQARQIPNFQVFFADPLHEKGVASDRYYLQFGGAGLEIKREASTGKRYHTVGLLNRTPNQFPDNELRIEIRVIRQTSRIELFLNGEPEGNFPDLLDTPPQGNGIVFVCNTQHGGTQEISAIEIFEYDDKAGRHSTEERGDPKTDSLISRDEDRWSGRLLGIVASENGPLFRFKNEHQDDPMEIPEAEVSTVFFADGDAAKQPQQPYLLRLLGRGLLQVSSCRFTEDAVIATHPLLGPLELRREGVHTMEHRKPEKESRKEP